MNDRRACSATPQNGFGCLAARMVIQTAATMCICSNFPTPLIGDYWGNVEANILETTLSIEADAIQANAGWQVFPNPVSALFEIRGYRLGQRWTVFDGWGRKVAEGQGSRVDASQWPVGMLWLVPSNSDNTNTARALKLNVVR